MVRYEGRMKTLLVAYLLGFVHSWWPHLTRYQTREADAIVHEIVDTTDGTPLEDLYLVNIAALESGFDRKAVGKAGERGAWQVMPPAKEYGAREALRRMRVQGWVAYVGCRHADDIVVIHGRSTTCQELIDHRTDRANLYAWTYRAPTLDDTEPSPDTVAGNP